MARCTPVSFDLVVFTLEAGASAADIRAAHQRCRRGEHVHVPPGRLITSFYRTITRYYPDRPGPGSPWAVSPLHVAADHVEMRLTESCADEVLLTIERLAAEHGLLLFDPQDGSVYPPPAVTAPPTASGTARVVPGTTPLASGTAPTVSARAQVPPPRTTPTAR